MIKINFGSGGGEGKLRGWINVDLDRTCRPDVIADLSKDLPFSTASVDYIHSEDFIVQLSLGWGSLLFIVFQRLEDYPLLKNR